MLTRRETLKAVAAVVVMGPTALAIRRPTTAEIHWIDNLTMFREWRVGFSYEAQLGRLGKTNSDYVVIGDRVYAPDTLLFAGTNWQVSYDDNTYRVEWSIERFPRPLQPVEFLPGDGARFWVYERIPFAPILATLTPVP